MIAPLYELIYVLPLCQILILIAGPYIGVPEKSVLGCLFSVVVVAFMHLIRYLSIKGKTITVGVGFTLYIGVYFALGKDKFNEGLEKYSWFGMCVLLAVVAYILGLLAANKKIFRRFFGLLLFGVTIYLMVIRKPVTEFAVVMCFLIMLLCLSEEVQDKWKKCGYTRTKDHMVMIFPIFFILCMLVLVIKAPEKPYDWQFVKVAWEKINYGFTCVSEWFSEPRDSYGDIGFSGDTSFSSHIDSTDKVALRVKLYKDNPKVIYLAGKSFDTFGENGWEADAENGYNSRMMDTIEVRCAVRMYDFYNEKDYISKTKNEIESKLSNTKFIFTPQKLLLSDKIFTDIPYIENAGAVNSEKKIREGDSYRIAYYKLNMTNPNMLDIINNPKEISQKDWESEARRELYNKINGFTYGEYEKYRKWIYENYCESGVASEKVKKLIKEITSGVDCPYEKLKAIEEYLRSLEYSVSPGALPDFVIDSNSYLDYFLSESKKGYCVHYATAFVLLARECGFPARYVQGYRIDNGAGEYAEVKESLAHAWAEVYFDNVGWITFEPTPGYSNDVGWDTAAGDKDGLVNKTKKSGSLKGKDKSTTKVEELTTEESGTSSEETLEEKLAKVCNGIRVVIIPIIAVFVFLCIYIALSRIIFKRKYARSNDKEKVKSLVNRNFRILKLLGYEISKYETLSEYKERVEEATSEDILESLAFIEIYEDILYADKRIDSDMVKQFEKDHDTLMKELCAHKKIYKLLNL